MDGDRVGTGLIDSGEVNLLGGPGIDYITGDNALISRNRDLPGREDIELFDVATVGSPAGTGTGGGDTIEGDAAGDWLFGQQGDDTIYGDFGVNPLDAGGLAGNDYIEGNDGQDTIFGEDGTDDIAGGGSANDGIIDGDRVGTGLLDEGELTVLGGAGEDYITGDNALISRNVPSGAAATIVLFDVATTASPAGAGTGGGDVLLGNADNDIVFGQQGNDTIDGDDGGGASTGPAGDDYIEGNDGRDTISGEDGQDDLIGGGSANDGVIDLDRVGEGLLDEGELLVSGGNGVDAITGDNAAHPSRQREHLDAGHGDRPHAGPGARHRAVRRPDRRWPGDLAGGQRRRRAARRR